MATLRKLGRLWKIYAYLDFVMVTRDFKTFILWYFSDMLLNIASVLGMLFLAERFGGVGEWSKGQMFFLLGYTAVVEGIVSSLFSYNIAFISRRIGRGQLDHTLVQPQPLWLALLTEGFSPLFGTAMLLPGMALLGWAMSQLPLSFTWAWGGLFSLNLLASVVVTVAFQFLWGSLAFWAPRSAEEINSSTMQLMVQLRNYPLNGLGPLLQTALMTVLPIGLLGWYPCRWLVGLTPSPWGSMVTPLAAFALALLTLWVFRQGMKRYARTGSQRYSDFGHRS